MNYKIVIDSCGELLERWKEDERIEKCTAHTDRRRRRYCR